MLYLFIVIFENILSTKNQNNLKRKLFSADFSCLLYICVLKTYSKTHIQAMLELWNWLNDISAQADTNKPVADFVWSMSVGVECHALETLTRTRCTEVRWSYITAPIFTDLVTVTCVTGNEEARVFHCRALFTIADQQLVGECLICPHSIPQSIGFSVLPIVPSNLYGLSGLSLEVGLVSSLVIDEHNFFEL